MACGNNDYNPIEHFTRVSGWVKIFPDKWKIKIEEYFKPEIAKEIISLIEQGNFDNSYGRRSLREILTKKDGLTNAKDVGGLETAYTTSAGVRHTDDFTRMKNKFEEKLISLLLLDPITLKTIRTSEIIPDLNIDRANKNLYDFKMELIKKLWSILQPDKNLDTSYQGSDAFTKLIAETLSLYNLNRISNPDLNKTEYWDTYFMLAHFDELLVSFGDIDFVKIKPEWASGRRKSNNMYEYIGPHVAYDTSFNPNEFATAEQYASKHLQLLLNSFFKQIDSRGNELGPIGFDMFNRAVIALIEWVESNGNSNYREELYKGLDDPDTGFVGTNWETLIDKFLDSRQAPKDLYSVLRGIKKLLSRQSPLDNDIKDLLNMQIARVVGYEYEVFRKKWDQAAHSNVIVPMRLREAVIDKQKGSIAKRVRSRVYRSIKRNNTWESFKLNFGITNDKNNHRFEFSGYTFSGKTLFLSLIPIKDKQGEFLFDWYVENVDGDRENILENDIRDDKIKELVERLLQIPITSNYKDLLGTKEIINTNLFDIFKPAIALAVSASEPDFANYSFRLDGKELEIKGQNYADLTFVANFVSIMRGIRNRTTLTNGLGNNLPVNQQRSAIFNAKRILDKGSSATIFSEHINSGIPEEYGIKRRNIYESNILRNVEGVGSPIGRVVVRTDYDYDGKNRTSAEMNFAELNYFSVFKSFYTRLLSDGKIALQTTCLSDKHTHFLIEFLTKQMRLRNGERLDTVLSNLTREVDTRAFNDSSLIGIESEIKWRRAQKTKVEMVNLLNRFEIVLGLSSYSTTEMSFSELKKRIDTINTYIKTTPISELNKLANEKNVAFFKEADLIELDGETFINETLYKNFMMYCDESSNTMWLERLRREKMAYCKDMFNAGVKLDTLLDKSLLRLVNTLRSFIPDFDRVWYNEKTGLLQPFIIKDKAGNIINPTHSKADIEKYFNSDEYIAVLNPVFNSYFYANALLANSFNDIVFGEDYGLENKYIKTANDTLKELKNQRAIIKQEIADLEKSLSYKIGEEYRNTERAIRQAEKSLKETEQLIKDNSYGGKTFLQYSEASRLTMHYKRTVHGGATYTPLVPKHFGVTKKVKVSVIDDVKCPVFSITGNDPKRFTSQDGAGWASPYWSRMCNVSYGDGAVGKNKKTIFSYVDPETGILTLIKWAEYEITNAVRRDSPLDNEHNSYEYAFMKMHNIQLTPDVFKNFDITDYYNLDDIQTKPLYVYNPETGQHFLIENVKNSGNNFTWDLTLVNENGKKIGDAISKQRYVNSIYDLDQIFGGAWVEEIQKDGRLDFTEAQNDLIHHIICDLNIKDKFIGWAVNASSVKSGMRNNNSNRSFTASNKDALKYFEMSTANGGAQMNADHVIGETEVTEMSQMISALVQNGLLIGRVNEIYKFIGQVAADSLGDIIKWQDDPDKAEEIYKWIGEALAYSFSKESDTMGLTTAFLSKVNQNLEKHGLLTRIPLSAPSIKGKFESTITSFINNEAIRRKYPGGGYVQNPTFDARLRYNFGGNSYSYSEFLEAIREYNKNRLDRFKVTAQTALNDYSWNALSQKFNNPFIELLSPTNAQGLDPRIIDGKRSTSTLDFDDTIIVFDLDENGQMINEEIIRLDDYYKWDKYRNFATNRYIAHWTVKPKNLLGSRTFFEVNGTRFTLYDLDSTRALMYSQLKPENLTQEYKDFLLYFVEKHNDELNFAEIDWNNKEQINKINEFAKWQVKKDLKALSKLQHNGSGEFEWQDAFGPIPGKAIVSNFTFSASQVLMGLGAKREFGIRNRTDLAEVQKDAKSFFVRQLQYLASKPLHKTVDPNVYDAVLHGADGTTALLVVDNLRDSLPQGLVPNTDYKKDDQNHIWYNGEDLGYAKGIDFYSYVGKDGEIFTVIKANNLSSFTSFNNASKLFTTFLPNATKENWKRLAENTPDVLKQDGKYFVFIDGEKREITNEHILNYTIEIKAKKDIFKLAEKKARSWNAYKKGVGTRIPAQSMQSFTEGEIIGFTDDDDTSVYVSTTLAWLMGSDFDIDKLYWMTYGFTDDGMLATFTDLDSILDPEECLALPKPKNRSLKVQFYATDEELESIRLGAYVSGKNYKVISPQGDPIKLLKECLSDDVENNTTLIVHISDMQPIVWDKYVQEHAKERSYTTVFEKWLKRHERSRRNNAIKKIALRNVVVKGILDVLHDVSTQYNLQIPISMDEQRDAADLSTMAAEERYLTSDQPGAIFKMTVQNMIGRDVIGIGASSLKAFFGATTYFNTIVENIQNLYHFIEDDSDVEHAYWENDTEVWRFLKSLVFNAKFGNRNKGLITFANINFDDLIKLLESNPTLRFIEVSDLDTVEANSNLGSIGEDGKFIYDFIEKTPFGQYRIDVLKFITELNDVSNGRWDSQIDAAYSLSGLISAATDNAKELILAKINATTKFADIYTYLLSIGEHFSDIAKFMISDEFNVVAKFAEPIIIDPNTSWFDLEHAINFILNEETLPVVDNKIFNWILTSINQGGIGVIDQILDSVVIGTLSPDVLTSLNNALGRTIWNGSNIDVVKGLLIRIINNNRKEDDPTEYTDDYKAIVAWVYSIIKDRPDFLIKFLQVKIGNQETNNINQEQIPEPEPSPDNIDDMEDAHMEDGMARSFNFNKQLSRDEWRRYLQYVVHYLIPKNEAMRGITDFSKLQQLRSEILPALKEQRMLSHLLGINQGLRTDDFEEYKWIRDVETFVNQRYFDNNSQDFEAFDMMRFIKDDAYREKQIAQYEKVKSTYNILDIISKSGHFWEMIKLTRTNRLLIEKAVANKYTRRLADKMLVVDKKMHGKISKGATQKLNEQEYKILQNAVRDVITLNWIGSLAGITINVPLRRTSNQFFDPNGNPKFVKNSSIRKWTKDGRPLDENGILIDDAITSQIINLNDTNGLATFKWLMENYIVDALQNSDDKDLKENAFIQDLQYDYRRDSDSESVIEFITLPISLSNPDHNEEVEEIIGNYKAAFDKIAKKKVPKELGIGDWTIGDLFFLYNLYVHKESLGGNSLTRLFDHMIISDDSSLLINNYYDYICRLDSGIESIQEIDEIEQLDVSDKLSLRQNSLLKDIRQQFIDTPSSASKFRVRKSEDGNYEFLDESYQKTGIDWPRSRVDKSYYLYNFALYNPVKLTENPSLQRVREMKAQAKSRNVNTKDAVEVVVSYLQKEFSGVIPITTVNDAWVEKNMKRLNAHAKNAPGFILNGRIYINVDQATVSTPIHELMHIIFAALKFGNDDQRNAYYNLLDAVKQKRNENDPIWQKYWNEVESLYKDYAIGSDLKEEVLIKYMEDIFTNAYLNGLKKASGVNLTVNSNIKDIYLEFEQRVINAVNQAFAIHLPLDTTAKDILGLSLGEILVNFNSALMDFDSEDVSVTYLPNVQRIAKFKRKMVEAGNLTINGDC